MHGKPPDQEGYLCGHMLIAMPTLLDPRFQRTVIYVCAHSAQGAMGIIVNRIFSSVTFRELLGQLGIPLAPGYRSPGIFRRTRRIRARLRAAFDRPHAGGFPESR